MTTRAATRRVERIKFAGRKEGVRMCVYRNSSSLSFTGGEKKKKKTVKKEKEKKKRL